MKGVREKRVHRGSANNPKNIAHLKKRRDKKIKKSTKESPTLEKGPYVNTIDISNNPKLLEYLKNASKRDKRQLNAKRVEKIINSTLKLIAKRMVYNEGGVFIKDFGYFCVVRYPKRTIVESFCGSIKKKWMNFQTNGYPHSATFIPIRKDTKLKEWAMERAFHTYNVTRIMSKLLMEGKRYKMNFSLLYNMNSNRNKTVDVLKNTIQ
jgi:nucleoid DNA-binding protein